MIEIPLTNDPQQTFTIDIDNILYSMDVYYNTRKKSWAIDISATGLAQVRGVSLLSGVNIVQQYQDKVTLSNLYAINLNNYRKDPTSENLGSDARLIHLTDEEIDSGGFAVFT